MRTIIAGSRKVTDYQSVCRAILKSGWMPTVVLCGMAKGVDLLGKQWAETHGIPVETYPVSEYEWNRYGPRAGILRNIKMAEHAEALIAIWDGTSPGTGHMIDTARRKKFKVYTHLV